MSLGVVLTLEINVRELIELLIGFVYFVFAFSVVGFTCGVVSMCSLCVRLLFLMLFVFSSVSLFSCRMCLIASFALYGCSVS